jgi:hypothetical protein
MRRWAAILLICLATFYLGATGLDECADGVNGDCAPVCHIFCADGCATVPVPDSPVQPAPDPLPRLCYRVECAERLVSLVIEPEKDPPRA